MNRDNINKTIFWSLLYIFLYSACTVIVNLFGLELIKEIHKALLFGIRMVS